MDAEQVIVELIANVGTFDSKVVQSATKFEGSMSRIQTAAVKGEAAVSKSSIAMLQASTAMHRGFDDVGRFLNSSPNSPFVVPVKQAPAVASAMRLIGTAGTLLGGIMGGLVASGVLAAAAALAEFILKGKGTRAEIDAMVEALKEKAHKTELARKADAEFSLTIEGVTKALDDNEEALKRIAAADETAAHQAAVAAELARIHTVEIRKETVALIEKAEAQLEVLRAQAAANGSSLRETGVGAEIGQIEGRLKTLRSALGVAQAELSRAEQQAREALSRAAVERGSESEVEGISRRYNKLVEATRVRLTNEKATAAEIIKQTKALREQQRIEEEAARAKGRVDHSNDQSGRQINEAQARAIVASIGGTVTSGTRTAKHNEDVGGVPGSFHVKGQAVDIAKTAGMTLGKIVKAFEAQGVRLIEKLDEGDHFHIAFARRRGKQGPSPETLAARAEAARLAAERREQAFENERATLDQGVIDARQALLTSAEEIAQLELAAIEISRAKYNDQLASLVSQKKLLPKEAAELEKLNDERAKLRTELVGRREDERKFRLQEAAAQRAVDFQLGSKGVEQDFLQSQEGLATTARQRRDQEQRLLDLQFEIERIQLQAIIAEAERLRVKQNLTDLEQAELERANDRALVAAQQLGTLDARKANADAGNAETNATPLESFFGDIPNTADEINQSFESIAAGGLASFTDGLTEAIMGMRSLGDVGRAVLQQVLAGLIKLGIQQLLLATIGQTVGAASTAANVALGATTAAAWAPAAAAVSLATFGANLGPALTALVTANTVSSALAAPKGFKLGGFTGNGPTGSPAGIVHGQEYVFDAAATKRIGVPALEAMRNGAVRPSNAVAVRPGGAGGGGFDAGELRSIVQTAIQAMPPVNLFPTFDPVAAMEAAINTKRGRQVMLEFMGDNSGAIGATG